MNKSLNNKWMKKYINHKSFFFHKKVSKKNLCWKLSTWFKPDALWKKLKKTPIRLLVEHLKWSDPRQPVFSLITHHRCGPCCGVNEVNGLEIIYKNSYGSLPPLPAQTSLHSNQRKLPTQLRSLTMKQKYHLSKSNLELLPRYILDI